MSDKSNHYDYNLQRFLTKSENKARIEALKKPKKSNKQDVPQNQNSLFGKEVMPIEEVGKQ